MSLLSSLGQTTEWETQFQLNDSLAWPRGTWQSGLIASSAPSPSNRIIQTHLCYVTSQGPPTLGGVCFPPQLWAESHDLLWPRGCRQIWTVQRLGMHFPTGAWSLALPPSLKDLNAWSSQAVPGGGRELRGAEMDGPREPRLGQPCAQTANTLWVCSGPHPRVISPEREKSA